MKTSLLKPKKSLGQNFLTDTDVLAHILEIADIQPTDTILEIGSGKGVLTHALAKKAKKVLALEIDTDLIPGLLREFPVDSNVTVIQQDILQTDIVEILKSKTWIPDHPPVPNRHVRVGVGDDTSLLRQTYRVIANLPYYITAPIIQHLLATQPQPQDIILMVQKEVAERITAQPGDMSILAVSVQAIAHAEYCFTVPKTAFDPIPKVDSAIIRITPFAQISALPLFFFRLVKIAFASKRKTLTNTLSAGLHLPRQEVFTLLKKLDLNPNIRAQELTLDQWHQLATSMAKYTTNKP